ncbi:hypothetical protein [Pseudoduganella umbonata]|uniref:Uncharacterized protein n=1 Tax=Pseudoduganella umbonata TaxID=864828 RepID=A0A4P8HQ00_9BURK|nr:hypothetical protein [Pseudoduganella umbonata]MBB3220692.1 hypothetical protein [Pseudoduganella umbonata]QCP11827.1 hypothetical protein FCL38_16415 [Pseudoduganella umbonata]
MELANYAPDLLFQFPMPNAVEILRVPERFRRPVLSGKFHNLLGNGNLLEAPDHENIVFDTTLLVNQTS